MKKLKILIPLLLMTLIFSSCSLFNPTGKKNDTSVDEKTNNTVIEDEDSKITTVENAHSVAAEMENYLQKKYNEIFILKPSFSEDMIECWEDTEAKCWVGLFQLPGREYPKDNCWGQYYITAVKKGNNFCDDYILFQNKERLEKEVQELISSEIPESKVVVSIDNFAKNNVGNGPLKDDFSFEELIKYNNNAVGIDISTPELDNFEERVEKASDKLSKIGLDAIIHFDEFKNTFYEDFNPSKMALEEPEVYTDIYIYNDEVFVQSFYTVMKDGKYSIEEIERKN